MLCLTSALHFLAKDSDHQGEGVRINFVGLRLLLSKGMLEGPTLKLFGGSCSPCPWVTQIPLSLGSEGRQVYEGVIWGLPALIHTTCNPTTQLALTKRVTTFLHHKSGRDQLLPPAPHCSFHTCMRYLGPRDISACGHQ